jgi:hypothetical protein
MPVVLSGESDVDGRFELGPAPRRAYRARVTHPHFRDAGALLRPDADDQTVVLEPGFDVRGTVTAWDGRPAAGASVRIRASGAS